MIIKGGDVQQLIETPYAQPYIQIVSPVCRLSHIAELTTALPQFYNVTQSTAASTALTALIFVLLIFGIINQVTTSSRQLWSFARDNGLPWSPFLSRVQPGMQICHSCAGNTELLTTYQDRTFR
jgi:choline transport protein